MTPPAQAMAPATSAQRKPDGRRLRTQRTREAIVRALVALLDEGDPAPTAARIAARAGVALRSIGQHFASREALLLAVAREHEARLPVPRLPAGAGFERRLAAFIAHRCLALEHSAAMRRAAQLGRARSPAIARAMAEVAAARRRELQTAFAPELKGAPRWRLQTLDLLTSGPAWDELRHQQRLAPRAAARVLAAAARQLLRR